MFPTTILFISKSSLVFGSFLFFFFLFLFHKYTNFFYLSKDIIVELFKKMFSDSYIFSLPSESLFSISALHLKLSNVMH